MPIGDDPFKTIATANLTKIFSIQGISVTVTRTPKETPDQLDAFFEPTTAPATTTFTASIVPQNQDQQETYTVGGGRVIENFHFVAQAAVLQENDEVTYNGNIFKVMEIAPAEIGGTVLADFCVGQREVQ